MDLQVLLDSLTAASRNTRSNYHLTLGAAIKALEGASGSASVVFDTGGAPGPVESYRGYYSDLAFEPEAAEVATVASVLADLKAAINSTFGGYKGGDFVMGENTPLWVSTWGGCSGIAVVGVLVADNAVTLLTKSTDD